MKKRAISMILALVMLFSCLSLNVFATAESADEKAASETVISDTLGKQHTAEFIEAKIPGKDKGTSNYSYFYGKALSESGLTVSNKAYRFDVTDDGRYVYGELLNADELSKLSGSAKNDSHMTVTRHSNTTGAGTAITNYTTSNSKGKNINVQIDLEVTDTFVKETNTSTAIQGSLTVIQIASYQHTNGNIAKGYWVGYGKLHSDGTNAYLAFPDYSKSGNAAIYANARYTLETNKTYTIALHVDPQDVRADKGLYGTYDVYINGECVFEDLGFLSKSYNDMLAKDPTVPFFSNSTTDTWTSSNYNQLKPGAKAYFFTDELTEAQLKTDTDEDGLLDILEPISSYITFDANGKATNAPTPVAIGTCEGVKDYCVAGVRLFQNPRVSGTYDLIDPYTDDAFYFDNIMVYYSEEYAGDFVAHKTTDSAHTHDFELGKCEITTTCSLCDGKKVAEVLIDKNGDRVCDICTDGIGINDYKKLTPSEVKTLAGGNTITATEFAMDTPGATSWVNDFAGSNLRLNSGAAEKGKENKLFEQIVTVEDENGNVYIKYQRPVTQYVTLDSDGKVTATRYGEGDDYYFTGSVSGEYLQKDTTVSTSNIKSKWNEFAGRPYVITVDYMHYGEVGFNPFQLRSPTLIAEDGTASTIDWTPIQIAADGTVRYKVVDEENVYKSTGHKLPKGEFATLSFVHTPATNSFDIYLNGLCIADNIKAVSDTNSKDYTGAESWNTTGIKGNSATGYAISMIRFSQMSGVIKADVMALDNIKFYYGDFLECDHKYVMTHEHDTALGTSKVTYKCAQCDMTETAELALTDAHCEICDGTAISANAAVVSKSVSLGEMIDMNVYMALSEKLVKTEGAKVTLNCGNRSAEYALADAVKEANGLYKFSIELRSTQMASDVEVKVVGETSDTYKTSIKAYAEELIETSDNAAAVSLAKAMLNYGAAAQKYFAVKNTDAALDDVLANAGLAEADQAVTDVTGSGAFNTITYAPAPKGEGVNFTAATIMFSAKTHVKVYFTASENATVTVGGVQVTPTASENEGEYFVSFTVENPAKFMDAVAISVTDTNGSVGYTFSAGLLVKLGIEANVNDNLTALLKAYAYYGVCAVQYVA